MTSSARASSTDLTGRVVGKYEIVRLIGGGGMGRVYEGLNTTIGKRVALKFIERDAATADAVLRFQREAQAASAVESAHIVEIFDSGTSDDGMPYIVMELLRGEDLGHRIRRLGRLEVPEALVITAQILRGLHRAHEAHVVHRDLKPDNVFLLDRDDDQTFAKIVDFGVSKITRSGDEQSTTITQEGTVLGTPVYMSPEQAQALPDVDGRADLWSVGAILYECLCGRPPHSGGTYEQVIVNICMKDVEDIRLHNPAVPAGVAKVITRALTREREERFQTARQFLDALATESGGVLSGRSVSTPDAARKNQTVFRSERPGASAATLGAVSTVAAVPAKLGASPASFRARSRQSLYVSVAVGAILLGAVIAVGVIVVRGQSAAGAIGAGGLQISSASVIAPVAGETSRADAAALPSGVAPAASVSAAPSAVSAVSDHSASPSASVSSRVRPTKPPPPSVTGKGGLGDGLKLQTH